jgi:hypothetical protein
LQFDEIADFDLREKKATMRQTQTRSGCGTGQGKNSCDGEKCCCGLMVPFSHPDFVALTDATQFARLANEYRNCLETHVVRAATGRAAFYIPKLMSGLIVELLRHTYAGKDLWVLKGIHSRGNARVGRRERQDIEALLRLRGITPLDMGHVAGLPDKLAAVLSPDVDFHDNY